MRKLLQTLLNIPCYIRSCGFAAALLSAAVAAMVYFVFWSNNAVFYRDENGTRLEILPEMSLEELLVHFEVEPEPTDTVVYTGYVGKVAEITLLKAKEITILADGVERTMNVYGGTVGQALAAANIDIDSDDLVSKKLWKQVNDGDYIIVTRMEYSLTYEEVEVPFETNVRYTSLMRNGRTRMLSSGVDGVRMLTYMNVTMDGEILSTELISDDVIRAPVAKETLVGKAGVPVSPLVFEEYPVVNNVPVKYEYLISEGVATGYSAPPGAGTLGGWKAAPGYVAVNYEKIPLGTKMYITSADGKFVYGYAIAADSGSALMSGYGTVDLFYSTYIESVLNGYRRLNIYILETP
ncbi:MAG: DUF348 domain-containing protein [Ruminococcaceae bacterium]|nr:DUF348 domain-containing protein [Oscillospiraceae bacterium]